MCLVDDTSFEQMDDDEDCECFRTTNCAKYLGCAQSIYNHYHDDTSLLLAVVKALNLKKGVAFLRWSTTSFP
jgi:hypothetical protein